jgi:hypothetical protein
MDPVGKFTFLNLDIFGTYDLPMCETIVRNLNIDSNALEGKDKM